MNPWRTLGCVIGGTLAFIDRALDGGEMFEGRSIRRVEEYVKEKPAKKVKQAKAKQEESPFTAPQILNMLTLDKGILTKTKEGQIYLVVDLVSLHTVKALNSRGKFTLVPINKLFEYHDPKVKTLGG